MRKAQNAPKTQHLPRFVGYAEVERSLGVSRRTVERMVREGKFPKPVQLAPNRVGWEVDSVTAWLAERSQGLVAHAVTHPRDLAPDEVAPTIRNLPSLLIKQELGEAASPEDVNLSISRAITNKELISCRATFLEQLEELCGNFSDDRALFVVASVFPALRKRFLDSGVGEPTLHR